MPPAESPARMRPALPSEPSPSANAATATSTKPTPAPSPARQTKATASGRLRPVRDPSPTARRGGAHSRAAGGSVSASPPNAARPAASPSATPGVATAITSPASSGPKTKADSSKTLSTA